MENKKAFRFDLESISCSFLVEQTRFGSELITRMETDGKNGVQMETSQTYVSRPTAFWRRPWTRAQTPAGPQRRCGPGGDVKRSWNVRESSGDGARAVAKTEQVAGPAEYHRCIWTHTYLTTNVNALCISKTCRETLRGSCRTIDDKSIPTSELLKWFPSFVSLCL